MAESDWVPVGSDEEWQPVNPSAPTPPANPAWGIAKQAASSLAETAAAVPGFWPRAIAGMGEQISRRFGAPETPPIINAPMTPDERLSAALPQPQGQAEELTRAMVGPAIGGLAAPGRAFANLVGGALSGAGGYAGEKLAPSFGFDPAAGAIVGSLAGGAVGAHNAENAANLVARRAVAPAEDIVDTARNTYNQLRAANRAMPIPQGGLSAFTESLTGYLKRFGPSPDNAPGAYSDIQSIAKPTIPNQPDVSDLVRVRQNLHGYLRVSSDSDAARANRAVAAMALPEIDNAIKNVSPDTLKALKQADANYSAGITAQVLGGKIEQQEGGNEAAYSGLNKGNKIKQGIDQILNQHTDERGVVHGLAPSDVAALRSARSGDAFQWANRYISGVLGGGGGLGSLAAHLGGEASAGMAGAFASSRYGGPDVDPVMAGVAAPVLGLLARLNYNHSVARGAANAQSAIKARSPYAQALGQGGAPLPMTGLPLARQTAGRSLIFARPGLDMLLGANQQGQ